MQKQSNLIAQIIDKILKSIEWNWQKANWKVFNVQHSYHQIEFHTEDSLYDFIESFF